MHKHAFEIPLNVLARATRKNARKRRMGDHSRNSHMSTSYLFGFTELLVFRLFRREEDHVSGLQGYYGIRFVLASGPF